ncbi:MAG: type 1 glutamine amidotransferase domain-containing protein [Rhodobacteraceae bacterium]|nr:type 1 glutamine amidotransferase domain-containing protein [Paracoccaceae bacterium]MCF8520997.1 type 1 glutamine amidotransferase domain-containing protein [Paracoccaceae bacterium]
MTAVIDIHKSKKILIIAANPGTSSITGWPIGFWWGELTHPYWTFSEAGYDIDIASPKGGALVGDSYSDPEDESGYSAHDLISLGFKKSPAHAGLLSQSKAIADLDPAAYDAIFVCGGQSPMVTMIDDTALHSFVAQAYEAGKVVAVVCHGTCILLKTRLSNGDLLVKGKTWTGFANSEEKFADNFVGKKIQPFWIEDQAKALPDTNFIVQSMFKSFVVRDGNLITGQQQYSGAAAADLVVDALGR